MKRFPFWLRAELLRARFVRNLRDSKKRNLILQLDLDHLGSVSDSTSNGNSAGIKIEAGILRSVQASDAPVVWIGGSEPLAHPGVGRLARRILDCGRTVFVETDGFYLRQRIHEFRPVSRLYLTPKFYGLQRLNDSRVGQEGVFARAMEGIRAAKLSGFLICGHVLVDAKTNLLELAQLKQLLLGMDADGLLVSAAPRALGTENPENGIAEQKLMEARKIVVSHGWGALGRLIECEQSEARKIKQNARDARRISQPMADEQEEGVEVR